MNHKIFLELTGTVAPEYKTLGSVPHKIRVNIYEIKALLPQGGNIYEVRLKDPASLLKDRFIYRVTLDEAFLNQCFL